MARLFIFAIGGTGSRVLKSLAMLLAAGIKPQTPTEFEIVPIIIDPHKENEDLKRTKRLLGNYQYITSRVGLNNGFFSTKITTLNNLVTTENRLSENFSFNLQQVSNTKFRDYIDFNQLDEANKGLADILFSGKTINKRHEEVNVLDTEMDIGFVGNPSIGSVVLNQFKDSEEFKEFASNFNEEDRIFIVSSIFGGTGAAGFPIVLKNIRDAVKHKKIDGKGFLQDARIGAITVMPYFNVEKDEKSPIQKSDFIAKTKSALYYYKDNVTGNRSVNCLYYIADAHTGKSYKNDPGDGGQQNNAHFVELASALAIIDFLELPDEDLETVEGKASNPLYREFGIRKDSTDISFSDLEDITERKISLKLSQFALFKKFLDQHRLSSIGKEPWSTRPPALDQSFFDAVFYRTYLAEFMDSFAFWLKEMADNQRGFAPFAMDAELPTFIKDRVAKSGLLGFGKVNYAMYDSKLNDFSNNKDYQSAEQKLIKIFSETTEDILVNKFKLEGYGK